MTKPGKVTYAEWVERYGMPALPPVCFRDDPPDPSQVITDVEHFSHTDRYRLTTPSPDQIARAGYSAEPEPGSRYMRMAVPVQRDGIWWITAVVFAVPCASVDALNRADDAQLMAFYTKVLAHGGKAELIGKLRRAG